MSALTSSSVTNFPVVGPSPHEEKKRQLDAQARFTRHLAHVVSSWAGHWQTRVAFSEGMLAYGEMYAKEADNGPGTFPNSNVMAHANGAYFEASRKLISGLYADRQTLQGIQRDARAAFPEIKPVVSESQARIVSTHLLDQAASRPLRLWEMARLAFNLAYLKEREVTAVLTQFPLGASAAIVRQGLQTVEQNAPGSRLFELAAPVQATLKALDSGEAF